MFALTPVTLSCRANSYVKSRLQAFDAPKASNALNFFSPCKSSKFSVVVEGAVIVRMRDGALVFNRSNSKLVSKNDPKWLVANIVSRPSTVTVRLLLNTAALLISTSSRAYLFSNSAAIARTEARTERSTSSKSTLSFPLAVLISACVNSPRCLSRQPRITVAPSFANPCAVALPKPELLPVTRQTLPRISGCAICTVASNRHIVRCYSMHWYPYSLKLKHSIATKRRPGTVPWYRSKQEG